MHSDFPTDIVDDTAHRPWPLPGGPWVMTQSWHSLLFAHWPMEAAVVRARVPAALPLDLFEGRAWVGVVPFRMTNVAPRAVPAMPWISAFAEVNVRTYVTVDGRPGVYFFSLDAESLAAVAAARTLFQLPYYHARMTVEESAHGDVLYVSRRVGSDSPAELVARYKPAGPAYEPKSGTLDYFLTERYCLYNVSKLFGVYRVDIHHPPWRLQPAEALLEVNTLADSAGLPLPPMPPLLYFSMRQDTLAWPPRTVEA